MKKYGFLVFLLMAVLAGCGKKHEPVTITQASAAQQPKEPVNLQTSGYETETLQPETSLAESSDAASEPSTEAEDSKAGNFSFADVAGMEFYFSSGAGGWYEVLHIKADGTFTGHFQDSDMGDTGENYPNGTLYYSDYNGSFTTPEKVNDNTYRFRIAQINYPYSTGEEIIDGTRYRYSTTYGLDEAEDLYMYLPGTKLDTLPQEFLRWVGYTNPASISGKELTFYGLYNENSQNGFQSYKYEPEQQEDAGQTASGNDPAAVLEQFIIHAEEASAGYEESLSAGNMSQADMNEAYMQIYTIWDETLNSVWSILKENLDEESMANITAEERAWIAEKEQAVQEASAEYEGGTMQPLAANSTAAEMTKERVYELAKYMNVYR